MSRFAIKFGMTGLALVAMLILSGCKREEPAPPPQPPSPPPIQYVVKVVPRPDTTDELQRIYTYMPDGVTLVKVEIQYRKDGRTQVQMFRRDGSLEEVQEMHPYQTKLKSSTKYASDGTTKVDETGYRIDGGLDYKTQFLADGSSKTLRYRIDGKRLLSESVKDASGRKTSTFYHKDGTTIWAQSVEESNGDTKTETFRADGTRDQNREVLYDRMIVTVHGADGVVRYKQTWSGYRYSYSYYRYYSLEKVEELNADGSVKRILEFERYGNRRLTKATDIVDGKPSKIRSFRYDGTLEKEEIFDADGTSKVENHTSSENITETYDATIKDEPKYDDPLIDNPSHLQ